MVSEWFAKPSRRKPMQVRVLYPPPLVSLFMSFLIYDHIQIRVTHEDAGTVLVCYSAILLSLVLEK